ncbi:MAG: PHP domain-containing protein, partial [Clostridia bacterium]|nr:PHP domain-containing protein [Clostridia bacterium]
AHKERAKQKCINSNPIQNYCYHTHTERCGHAAKDTSDREFIENAIQGGIKKVAFTDHIPMPDGLN